MEFVLVMCVVIGVALSVIAVVADRMERVVLLHHPEIIGYESGVSLIDCAGGGMTDVDLMREEIAMLENQNRRQCGHMHGLRGVLGKMIERAERDDPLNPHLDEARTAMGATICEGYR